MVRAFGWTLEYIDALAVKDLHEYLQVQDGEAKAQTSFLNQRKGKG